MKIVFFSNFINHHQKPVSDVLYHLTNGDYLFVEVVPIYDWLKQGGYSDLSDTSYVLRAWECDKNKEKARCLALEADVALFGGHEVLEYAVLRSKLTNKISFEVGERWLKRGFLNFISPRLLKFQWYYHTLFYKKPYYRLCSSAFAAKDEYCMRSFIGRCYKWGYFTKVNICEDAISVFEKTSPMGKVTLMWCARYVTWKHPELPILMAKKLKKKGYCFTLDMYGGGEYYERTKDLAKKCDVDDVVKFYGNIPNDEILSSMRDHDIFLFTSDQNEGWGAVVNEAMSNGCIVVGSDATGSTPYLLKSGVNGFLFKSASKYSGFYKSFLKVDSKALDSLIEKVEWLLKHPFERKQMAISAYKTIAEIWSPQNAAKNLLLLINNLQQGLDTPVKDGPCSKA